jgi:CO/xanthine dehydrogenase Mo-binding subunit
MSAPAAVANAVADALGLDRLDTEVDLELPLTPARVWALIRAADAVTTPGGGSGRENP